LPRLWSKAVWRDDAARMRLVTRTAWVGPV
jgi:hypothetical protein